MLGLIFGAFAAFWLFALAVTVFMKVVDTLDHDATLRRQKAEWRD